MIHRFKLTRCSDVFAAILLSVRSVPVVRIRSRLRHWVWGRADGLGASELAGFTRLEIAALDCFLFRRGVRKGIDWDVYQVANDGRQLLLPFAP